MNSSKRHIKATSSAALAVTTGLLLLAVLLARSFNERDPAVTARTDEESIDAVIEGSISAAKEGDLDAWLNCYAGAARDQKESSLAVSDRERFAAGLRHRTESLRSYVTTNWQVHESRAIVELEHVFAEHNVRMKLELHRISGTWKIVAETPFDEFSPDIPYGTPVVPESSHSK